MTRTKTRLSCTLLEDRLTPALSGLPWADPGHLTFSYAPDGTNIAGAGSQMFAKLNALMPTATWQTAVADAIQTWISVTGATVGRTTDSGAAFGVTGPTQGDSRFGDIRIAATPMPLTTYAEAVPPDPYLSGTFAGDIVLNSNVAFTPSLLKAVVLHEMGHALGLEHSADPLSVMNKHLNTTTTLASSDITAVQALYGIRVADRNEGSNGNGTLSTATHLKFEGDFDGQIPSVQWGDIASATDKDVFEFNPPHGYTGPVTFRVQTAGISLLAPKLTITDHNGAVLAVVTSTAADGTTLVATLPSVVSNNDYFLRVESSDTGTHAIGRYGVAVTTDGILQTAAIQMTIDQVLRGPYDTVKNNEAAEVFLNPNAVLFNDDFHSDDSAGTAQLPYADDGFAANTLYRITGSLRDAADSDYYRLKTPATAGPWVLSAVITKFGTNGLVPRVQVMNADQAPIAATILANGNGRFAVQVAGLAANQDVYLKILPNGATGNYDLEARFRRTAVALTRITQGVIATDQPSETQTLQALRPTLLGLALTATGGPLRLTITPGAGGAPLLDITAAAGDTVTGITPLLPAGMYTLTVQGIAGGTVPASYSIRGSILTDPVGPKATDPTSVAAPGTRKREPASIDISRITILDPFLWLIGLNRSSLNA